MVLLDYRKVNSNAFVLCQALFQELHVVDLDHSLLASAKRFDDDQWGLFLGIVSAANQN